MRPRLQGRDPARQRGQREDFGGGAIKESSLDVSKIRADRLDATKIGKVNAAALADGISRHGVISNAGALVRGRGITSVAKPGPGVYQVVFDADVRGCTYFATIGDEGAAGPGTGQISVSSSPDNMFGVRVIVRNNDGRRTSTGRSTCSCPAEAVILEIRTYRLRPGRAERFVELMRARALPPSKASGCSTARSRSIPTARTSRTRT